MDIRLTPDQEAFVQQGIQSGRFQSVQDAVQQALSLWEERERRRAEILVSVDQAETSLAEGKGRIITRESLKVLADGIKARGRARLAKKKRH